MPSRSSAVLAVLLTAALAAPASAAMSRPRFAAPPEAPASYDPQRTCSPTPKPGPVRFSAAVLRAYPGTGSFGIVRACGVGGRSEHKEGRAWDWRVSADAPAQRAQAHDLLRWLFATDAGGVRAANAHRVGVMYVIFDRRIWSARAGGTGWRPYTGANPHTDHMHLSFSWSGALGQTSWYAATLAPAPRVSLPAPTRGAPLPAPRPGPAPLTPVPHPEEDDDHEGDWRPGRPRAGDDDGSHGRGRSEAGRGRERAEQTREAAEERAEQAQGRAERARDRGAGRDRRD